MGEDANQPGPDFSGSGPVEYDTGTYETGAGAPDTLPHDLLNQAEAMLLGRRGVSSVGLGYGPAGGEALIVGVSDMAVARDLPEMIGDLPVLATVIGEVDALRD